MHFWLFWTGDTRAPFFLIILSWAKPTSNDVVAASLDVLLALPFACPGPSAELPRPPQIYLATKGSACSNPTGVAGTTREEEMDAELRVGPGVRFPGHSAPLQSNPSTQGLNGMALTLLQDSSWNLTVHRGTNPEKEQSQGTC